ncbi:hypothetical protein Drorol1_Dr00026120 [Drosera rotundifolia]
MALTSLLQNPNPDPTATTFARHRLHLHHHTRHRHNLNHHLSLPGRHVTKPLSLNSSPPSSNPSPIPPKTLIQTLTQTLNSFKIPLFITLAAASSTLLFYSVHLNGPPLSSFASSTITNTKNEKEKSLIERLKSDPDNVKLLRELVDIRVEMNDMKGGIKALDRLIELEPDETEWRLMRAHMYGYLRKNRLARDGFEELLERNPRDVKAYHALIMAVGNEMEGWRYDGELGKVRERIEKELEKCREEGNKGDERDFRFLVAQVRFFEGKKDEGMRIYEELLEEDPTDFRVYLCQGVIYTLTGKKEEGEKCFELYKRYVPKDHPHIQDFEDTIVASKRQTKEAEERKAAAAPRLKSRE